MWVFKCRPIVCNGDRLHTGERLNFCVILRWTIPCGCVGRTRGGEASSLSIILISPHKLFLRTTLSEQCTTIPRLEDCAVAIVRLATIDGAQIEDPDDIAYNESSGRALGWRLLNHFNRYLDGTK